MIKKDGIIIRTVAQRKNKSLEENTLIAKTKPCKVQRIGPSAVQMTLVEGRNRQIRKMMEAIGFTVVRLHRVEFMGIKLSRGLEVPGDWDYLDKDEMELVKAALRSEY
jgi:pseudouridine synthase